MAAGSFTARGIWTHRRPHRLRARPRPALTTTDRRRPIARRRASCLPPRSTHAHSFCPSPPPRRSSSSPTRCFGSTPPRPAPPACARSATSPTSSSSASRPSRASSTSLPDPHASAPRPARSGGPTAPDTTPATTSRTSHCDRGTSRRRSVQRGTPQPDRYVPGPDAVRLGSRGALLDRSDRGLDSARTGRRLRPRLIHRPEPRPAAHRHP